MATGSLGAAGAQADPPGRDTRPESISTMIEGVIAELSNGQRTPPVQGRRHLGQSILKDLADAAGHVLGVVLDWSSRVTGKNG